MSDPVEVAAQAIADWYWIDPDSGERLPGGPDHDDYQLAKRVIEALKVAGLVNSDIDTEKKYAERDSRLLELGAITPNKVREKWGWTGLND